MLTINTNTHIYDLRTIKYNFTEHADSTSSATICVLTLSPKVDKYLISKVLENHFDIPYMKQEQGYAEMRPDNPYRYNHIYDKSFAFSLDVDDPTIYRDEFKYALSLIADLSLFSTFIAIDYDELTNKLKYTTLAHAGVLKLFEDKLEKAHKKIEAYNSKPVQKLLKQIDLLSDEERNILLNNLSY